MVPGGVARSVANDSGRRTRQQMRLWIGLWCDRSLAGVAPDEDAGFVFAVDGVEMWRVDPACPAPTEAPGVSPNGGFTSFTLSEGRHVLTVTTPDGLVERVPMDVNDDTWAVVTHDLSAETQRFVTAVELGHRHLEVDPHYQPDSRPGPPGSDDPPHLRPSGSPGGAPASAGADGQWNSAADPTRITRGGSGAPAQDEGPWLEGTPGQLVVQSAVPVRVFIDGRDTGETTPTTLPVNAGQHRVTLRGDGGFEREFSVRIDGGRTRTLVNDEAQ